MHMNFGKYGPEHFPPNGVDVAFINSGYLRWLMKQSWFVNKDDDLVVAVERELAYRDNQNCHFDEDKVSERINNKPSKKEETKTMNDQFVPNNAGNPPVPNVTAPPVMPEMSMEVKANLELAKATQDGRLLKILQQATMLKQLQQFKKIMDKTQYDQAIDAFKLSGELVNELEKIRHEYVDFPTLVTKLINQFFKTIRDGLQASKEHLGRIIDTKKQEDEAAAARIQKEQQEKIEAGEPVVVEKDGVEVVQLTPDFVTTEAPGNVITSTRGAQVQTRKDLGIELEDLTEFLKVCVSKNQRNKWLSDHVEEVIEVKLTPLKKLIKENKKKSVPGLKLDQIRRTV